MHAPAHSCPGAACAPRHRAHARLRIWPRLLSLWLQKLLRETLARSAVRRLQAVERVLRGLPLTPAGHCRTSRTVAQIGLGTAQVCISRLGKCPGNPIPVVLRTSRLGNLFPTWEIFPEPENLFPSRRFLSDHGKYIPAWDAPAREASLTQETTASCAVGTTPLHPKDCWRRGGRPRELRAVPPEAFKRARRPAGSSRGGRRRRDERSFLRG